MNALKLVVNNVNIACLGDLFEELCHEKQTFLVVFITLMAAGSETTMTSSSGQTFQITGTSVGGKVVTTKLSVPANSKIVTVNVPTSQGGMEFWAYLYFITSWNLVYACLSALLSTAHIPNVAAAQKGTRGPTQTRVAMIVSPTCIIELSV